MLRNRLAWKAITNSILCFMIGVSFVIGRAKHLVSAKIFGISKFCQQVALRPKIEIIVGAADTNFVQIKKQTLYGHNTASNGPFGVIYGSICYLDHPDKR